MAFIMCRRFFVLFSSKPVRILQKKKHNGMQIAKQLMLVLDGIDRKLEKTWEVYDGHRMVAATSWQ